MGALVAEIAAIGVGVFLVVVGITDDPRDAGLIATGVAILTGTPAVQARRKDKQ